MADMAACWLSFQLSLDMIRFPLPSNKSIVGSPGKPVIPKFCRVGPSARNNTSLEPLPPIINPPIKTLLPVSTFIRVEMFSSCPIAPENSDVFPLGSVAVAVNC